MLSVVATGSGFAEARHRVYEALALIGLDGGQFRSDIAERVDESAAPITVALLAPAQLGGWRHVYSGKVRDLYVPADTTHGGGSVSATLAAARAVLVVASDRVSAFDYVLEPGIPGKGALLTTLSRWWFEQLEGFANHVLSNDRAVGDIADLPPVPGIVADRAMVVKSLEMYPIECVVRGYLSGSGWVEYQATQSVCGVRLPAGLNDGDKLPVPIYTPAFKAELGEHDENITYGPHHRGGGAGGRGTAARPFARHLRARRRDRRDGRNHSGRHEVRIRCRPRDGRDHPGRRSAHERLEPVLGCRGLRLRRPHGELRQADRAQLAVGQLEQAGHSPCSRA